MKPKAFLTKKLYGKTRIPAAWLPLIIAVVVLCGCASDKVDFRRFEIGKVDARAVLDTAVEVVRDYYTNVHSGLTLFVNEDNMSLETSYIQKRSALDQPQGDAPVTMSMETLRRQRFFLKVKEPLDAEKPVEIEMLATYQIRAFEDPDELKEPDDLWIFVKQDTKMEDLVFELMLERLIEKKLID